MSVSKQPSFSRLTEPKGKPFASTEPEMPLSSRDTAPASRAAVDIKTMQVRVNRSGWIEMTRLAQDLDIALESLMVEAFNDVLLKHRKPPLVERRQPAKR